MVRIGSLVERHNFGVPRRLQRRSAGLATHISRLQSTKYLHRLAGANTQLIRSPGLEADPLEWTAGSIWNAYVVDYPYHSFSHIGIYYGKPDTTGVLVCMLIAQSIDGVNGRLPNLDLVNSAAHIARWIGGVPVRLHNETYEDPLGSSLTFSNWKPRYSQRAKGLMKQVSYGMKTQPSGPEGLFGQYVRPRTRCLELKTI